MPYSSSTPWLLLPASSFVFLPCAGKTLSSLVLDGEDPATYLNEVLKEAKDARAQGLRAKAGPSRRASVANLKAKPDPHEVRGFARVTTQRSSCLHGACIAHRAAPATRHLLLQEEANALLNWTSDLFQVRGASGSCPLP